VPLYAGYVSLFIAHLVGRIVSEVRVSVKFSMFCFKNINSVCPVMMFLLSLPLMCQKGHFSVPPVLSYFREAPLCAVACFLRTPASSLLCASPGSVLSFAVLCNKCDCWILQLTVCSRLLTSTASTLAFSVRHYSSLKIYHKTTQKSTI